MYLGLRENYDIFPNEIYYSLSTARIQEYEKRWAEDGELFGVSYRKKYPEGSKEVGGP